jgi:hypothetical protein
VNRKIIAATKAAAALSIAGGILAAVALPADAASPNEAYGAAATGPISLSQQALATYPGTSPVTLASLNVAGLITSGVLNDAADATSASSSIANPSVTLALATLMATTVSSSCSFDTNTGMVSGLTSLADAQVATPLGPITLAANPAKNTTVSVPGIASITLNKQTTAADGTLTVDAIDVSLIGSTQTIDLGVSVCNAADLSPVPILPSKAQPAALVGFSLLFGGGLGYHLTRRRRQEASA